MKKEMWNNIEKLSELRSKYSCFNEEEEPFYRALSLGIKGIKALEQEPCRDMEEIREVMGCDADAETKCKMISNLLTAKSHYFEKQESYGDAISRQYLLDNCVIDKVTMPYVPISKIQEAPPVNPQEPKYCDRNICISNEYNGIGCDECEVTKSQEGRRKGDE